MPRRRSSKTETKQEISSLVRPRRSVATKTFSYADAEDERENENKSGKAGDVDSDDVKDDDAAVGISSDDDEEMPAAEKSSDDGSEAVADEYDDYEDDAKMSKSRRVRGDRSGNKSGFRGKGRGPAATSRASRGRGPKKNYEEDDDTPDEDSVVDEDEGKDAGEVDGSPMDVEDADADKEEPRRRGSRQRKKVDSLSLSVSHSIDKESSSRRQSSRSNKFKNSLKEPTGTSIKDLFDRVAANAATEKAIKVKNNNRQRGMFSSSEDSAENENSKTSTRTRKMAGGKKTYTVTTKQAKSPARRHKRARLRVHLKEPESSEDDSDIGSVDDEESSEDEDRGGPCRTGSARGQKNKSQYVEEEDEEPLKIQRILASRTEPRSGWKEICKNMNTSEIDYGSRWYQDRGSDGAENDESGDDTYEERFLVKWQSYSFLHCSWETEKDLIDCIEGAKTYLTTFFRKSFNGILLTPDERCDGDYFDPAYTQIERILFVKDPSDDVNVTTTLENEDKLSMEDRGIIVDKAHPNFDVGTGRQFMIKWCSVAYTECTYEFERDLILHEIDYKELLKDFLKRNAKPKAIKVRSFLKSGDDELRKLYKIFGDNINLSNEKREERAKAYQKSLESMEYRNGGKLRDYQAEGVAWMIRNFVNKRGSILADEMGLGKTIQTAAFINQLATKLGQRGPFLIVAPLSTLAHWYREFTGWTTLNTVIYHGSADDRKLMRELEMAYECDRPKGNSIGLKQFYLRKCGPNKFTRITSPWMVEVVITTPEMFCADDYGELTCIQWDAVVVDEAHRLKNHNSKFAVNLRDKRFQFGHKLLLTGTPIQNDVKEFWTLLNVIQPNNFDNCDEFMENYGDMKSKETVDELHDVIRDYILRRLKEDVEKSVPPKEETLIEVELTITQKQYYRALYEKNVKFLHKNKKKALDGPSLNNLAMQLRKCCNHLFLLNGVEEDIRKKEEKDKENTKEQEMEAGEENALHTEKTDEDGEKKDVDAVMVDGEKMERLQLYKNEGDLLVKQSGKLVLLDKLLPRLKENGHRVLLFSQFKIMLDVLEDYFNTREFKFERIDGSITGKKRQQAIDRFQAPVTEGKEQPFIMLLSTRAGGVGINLTAADTCIIFDSDWNPQNDLQAQARCHRIGQTKSVKVYRLLTRKTYEMQMFHMSSLKMGLDQAVLQGFESGKNNGEVLTKEEVERLLRHGAYDIFNEEKAGTAEAESNDFIQQDIDSILERRARTVIHENTGSNSAAAGGTFSKARFTAAKGGVSATGDVNKVAEDVDIEDPEFWKKMVGEATIDDELAAMEYLPAKRRKRTAATYSENDYYKSMRESMESGSDMDAGANSSDGDDSFVEGDDGSGINHERSKWGGRKGQGWKRENVEKLCSLLQLHGYGNISWEIFCKKLNLPSQQFKEEDIIRMSWSVLLLTLLEAAEDDASSAIKREERAAEKRRVAAAANDVASGNDGQQHSPSVTSTPTATGEGGKTITVDMKSSFKQHFRKSFKKIWNSNVSWASKALLDAVRFAQVVPARTNEIIDRKLKKNDEGDSCYLYQENGVDKKTDKGSFDSLFSESFWPSLRSRGWKAEVVAEDGDDKGKTRYTYGTKQHLTPKSVLASARIIHPELSKMIDQLESVSESSRQKSLTSEAELRAQHLSLNHKNVDVEILTDFVKRYAPLQLLVDRTKPRKIHLSKKSLNTCSSLGIVHSLMRRAVAAAGIEVTAESTAAGSHSVLDKLVTMLSVDKRMSLPHPLWTNKHDAILIGAISKHGWIDHEDSCREIIADSTIMWGFPFDNNVKTASDGAIEGEGGGKQRDEQVKNLRDTAMRAARFFNLEGKGLEEMKGFNQHLVISAFGLVRQDCDADGNPSWSVDDASLMASTGLKASNGTEDEPEPIELPTKRDLVKRVKVVLSRSAELESLGQTSSHSGPQNNNNSVSAPGNYSVIDQSARSNVFLAELLRGLLKLPLPKMMKESRLICSLAYEETLKQCDAIIASSDIPGGGKKAEEMKKVAQQIAVVKRNLPNTRQAKNIVRVMLGLDPLATKMDGLFPDSRPDAANTIPRTARAVLQSGKKDDGAVGDRAISRSIKRIFDANSGGPSLRPSMENLVSDLELTAIEILIVTVICSQGLPVWIEEWESIVLGVDKKNSAYSGEKFTIIWAGLGNVLETAAKNWHITSKEKLSIAREEYAKLERGPPTDVKFRAQKNLDAAKFLEKVKRIAMAQAADYASDPLILAKKTVMLLERLRLHMGNTAGASKNSKKHNNWLGCKIFQWLGNQLSKWANSLEIIDEVKKTLSYTAVDFYHDLPPDERNNINVFASLSKQDCRFVVSQIALLSRVRSIFLRYNEEDLTFKVEKAAKNSRNCGDVWEKRPSWWGLAQDTSHQQYCIRHDLLLLNSLLQYGFGGLLENSRGFGSNMSQDDDSKTSLKGVGLTKASLQERANQLVRELDTLEGTEELIRLLGERRKQSSSVDHVDNVESGGIAVARQESQNYKCQKGLDSFFAKSSFIDKDNFVILSETENDDVEVLANVKQSTDGHEDVNVVTPKEARPRMDDVIDITGGSPSKKLRKS